MDTFEAIFLRRSIRNYKDELLSDEMIQKVLDAACMAPSAMNLQPWYFVAIKDNNEKAFVLEIMQKVALNMKSELEERFKDYPEVVAQTLAFTRSLGSAGAYILVFEQKDYGSSKQNAITQSIAAAIENLCLSAQASNLGTCWMCAPINAGFGDDFRAKYAPNKGKMVAMVALGAPNQTPSAPKRKDDRYKII